MLAQLPKLAGLFLVVCFGSCMDVAAIQSDMPTPLDFNRELMTVGGCAVLRRTVWVVGLCGGRLSLRSWSWMVLVFAGTVCGCVSPVTVGDCKWGG